MIYEAPLSALIDYLGPYELMIAAMAVLAISLAFVVPTVASRQFAAIERVGVWVAPRPILAVMAVVACLIVARVALIPALGTPQPTVPDEASLLLQADTYANGRMANPADRVFPSFQTIYVLTTPTYSSAYPVLRSLPMATTHWLGFGYWPGVFASVIVLVGASFFLINSYFGAASAFLVSMIVVLRYGLFNYWTNSYFGPILTALGGVLLVYGYRRMSKARSLGSGFWVGAGLFLLMTTRPYEGLVFSVPFVVAIVVMIRKEAVGDVPKASIASLFPVAFVAAGLGLTALHNHAVTGEWSKFPFELYRQQTAKSPVLLVQPFKGGEVHTYDQIQSYMEWESRAYRRSKSSVSGLMRNEIRRAVNYLTFYVGSALLIPFALGLWAFRREPTFVAAGGIMLLGLGLEVWNHAHYASPAFGLFLLAIAAGLSDLRRWRPGNRPIGVALSRLLVVALATGTLYPAFLLATGQVLEGFASFQSCCWLRSTAVLHGQVASYIGEIGDGKAIVFVDTGPRAPVIPIVYNEADLDKASILWVNDDPKYNAAAVQTYTGRKLWRLDWGDADSACLRPARSDAGAIVPTVGNDACVVYRLDVEGLIQSAGS